MTNVPADRLSVMSRALSDSEPQVAMQRCPRSGRLDPQDVGARFECSERQAVLGIGRASENGDPEPAE